jgi:hypothetical protein
MADDTVVVHTSETPPSESGEGEKTVKADDSVPPEIRAALKKANKEAETLRLKLQQFEDAQKSEAQKLAERAEQAERERDALRVESLCARIAIAKGVPPDLLEFLTATDEDELNAQAERLMARLASTEAARPKVDVDQGARPGPLALNGDPLLDSLKNKLGIR